MLAYLVPLVKRQRVRLGLSEEVGAGPALGVLVVQLAFTTKSQRHQGSFGRQVFAGGCTLPDRYSIILGTGQLLRLAKEPDARLPPMPENVSRRH
jgi:hypothetical protein